MVSSRGAGEGSNGQYGGGLVGVADQAEMKGPSWSDREDQGKGVRDMGTFRVDGGPLEATGCHGCWR